MAIALDIGWEGRSAMDFSRVFATAAAISSFRPVFNEISKDVVAPSIAANFAAGGRPPWAPLSILTLQNKAAKGHSSRVLVATGAMEEAATDPHNYQIGDHEMRAAPFGIPYWVYHQSGTPNMPQRVIMMLQAQDRVAIFQKFANYIRTFMVFDPSKPGGRQFTGGRRF